MAAKVELKISVNVGTGSVYNLGKIYDEGKTVKVVVDASIAKAAVRENRSLIFETLQAAPTEAALAGLGTELDPDDFDDLHVRHLRDTYGRFLKINAVPTARPSTLARQQVYLARTLAVRSTPFLAQQLIIYHS